MRPQVLGNNLYSPYFTDDQVIEAEDQDDLSCMIRKLYNVIDDLKQEHERTEGVSNFKYL